MKLRCCRCKKEKDVSEFCKKKTKRGYSSDCKECHKEYCKEHYKSNKKYYEEKRKRNHEKYKQQYIEYKKSLSCQNCDEDRWYVLDFHHRNSDEKEMEVATMMAQGCSFETTLIEIEKCDVLCKNCHAEVHFLQQN